MGTPTNFSNPDNSHATKNLVAQVFNLCRRRLKPATTFFKSEFAHDCQNIAANSWVIPFSLFGCHPGKGPLAIDIEILDHHLRRLPFRSHPKGYPAQTAGRFPHRLINKDIAVPVP